MVGDTLMNADGTYADGHYIAKAFEALRVEFPGLPQSFYAANHKRAQLVLEIEGRSTANIVTHLREFAKHAEAAEGKRSRLEGFRRDYPEMARQIERGFNGG